jgi:tRNA uridine 5-carbamoylmethylation protein Kti12
MNNLYVLCGIPGCGKSTWVKNRMAENTSSTDPKWAYVSRDEVRFSMITEEDDYFSKEKQVFEEFVNRICGNLSDAYIQNVIADATHLNEISRDKLINAIRRKRPNLPLHITMVYFDIPLEVCKFRNDKREGRAHVPDEVMNKMYVQLEFPKLRKGLEAIEIVRD